MWRDIGVRHPHRPFGGAKIHLLNPRIVHGLFQVAEGRIPDASLSILLSPDNRIISVRTKGGNASEAYTDFTAAVTADPTHVPAMGNLAALDAEAGRTAAAIAWVDRLLAVDPHNEKARAFRATLVVP